MNAKENDNNEMERAFLSSLLIDAERGQIETRLRPDDFEYKTHGRIFETILKQWKDGTTPTIITLCHDLAPEIPASTIAGLTNIVPSNANIQFYEKFIFEESKTRNFIQALKRAKEEIDGHTKTDVVIKNLIPALVSVTTARNEAGIRSVTDLLNTQFPDIRWIVPNLIGEGLTLLNGAPKIGKSWFVLNLAIAAASGGRFLGKLPATKTDTLYLALEDTERRIYNRLRKLEAPEANNLKIATQWRDGYIGLENYLKANGGIGLVIIDTLARFANINDMNDYSITTNAMSRLKQIADDMGIAVILIHHAKKTGSGGKGTQGTDWIESALGSTGLTGAADTTVFIKRSRSDEKTESAASLYATGRDAADIQYALKLDFDLGGWTIADNAEPKPSPGNNQKCLTRETANGRRQ